MTTRTSEGTPEATLVAAGELTPAAPFSLARAARFLGGFAPCSDGPVCSWAAGAAGDTDAAVTVRAAFQLGGRAALVEVAQSGPTLRYAAYADPGPPPDPGELATAVGRWLSVDDPLAEFYALAEGDQELARPVRELSGLHQVRFGTLAEGLTWFTLTHRVGQPVALGWKRQIAQRYGPAVRRGGEVTHAFPSLGQLLAIPEPELLDLLGSAYRVSRYRGALAGVAALGERWLREVPFERARAGLLDVPGIGPFTSDALLFRVLGRRGPIEVGAPPASRRRYGDWIGYWSYYRRACR